MPQALPAIFATVGAAAKGVVGYQLLAVFAANLALSGFAFRDELDVEWRLLDGPAR